MTISSESPETSQAPDASTPASTNGQPGRTRSSRCRSTTRHTPAAADSTRWCSASPPSSPSGSWSGVRQHRDAGQRIGHRAGLGDGQHGLAVRADRIRVRRLRAVAGARPVRHHPARPRRRGTRVPDHFLGGDDVQRRHGHRPDVLRCRRAADALRDAASGNGRARATRSGADRDGHHAVPLDAAPVGDLCGRRAGHRLRRLPARAGCS